MPIPADLPADLPDDLRAGYGRFRAEQYPLVRDVLHDLAAAGQRPRTMVVACADSRSAPELVFDARLGDLFVVRNIAALVPPYAPDSAAHGVSSALEYGVLALEVASVVVLGHARCGGIAAALQDPSPLSDTDFIGQWVRGLRSLATPGGGGGSDAATDEATTRTVVERRSIERSIDHLRTFPWIAERVAAGRLSLVGAWFDVELGELHERRPEGWRAVRT